MADSVERHQFFTDGTKLNWTPSTFSDIQIGDLLICIAAFGTAQEGQPNYIGTVQNSWIYVDTFSSGLAAPDGQGIISLYYKTADAGDTGSSKNISTGFTNVGTNGIWFLWVCSYRNWSMPGIVHIDTANGTSSTSSFSTTVAPDGTFEPELSILWNRQAGSTAYAATTRFMIMDDRPFIIGIIESPTHDETAGASDDIFEIVNGHNYGHDADDGIGNAYGTRGVGLIFESATVPPSGGGGGGGGDIPDDPSDPIGTAQLPSASDSGIFKRIDWF